MSTTHQPGRRLALFDLDGTLTRHDTYFPFVLGLLLQHPLRWPRVALLIIPAVGYLLKRVDRGGLKGAILHCLFAGMHRDVVTDRARRFADETLAKRMHTEGVKVFRAHLAAGDHVVILSASPDLFVPAIGKVLGAHEVLCTPVRWEGSILDGRLSGPNHRDKEKARVLEQLRARLPGLPVIAYGNSTADLDHMVPCEEAVYVNADPQQAAELTAQGMRCVQWR